MKCFFTWNKFSEGLLWNNYAKLATLWFDEIILQAPSDGVTELLAARQAEKENWSNDTLDNVNRVWSDVHKYIPDYDWIGITSLIINGVKPAPFNEEGHYSYRKTIRNAIINDWKQNIKKYEPFCPIDELKIPRNFEVSRDIVEAIDLFFNLRIMNINCTFLSGTAEDRILRNVLSSKIFHRKKFDVFSEFTATKIPDVTNFSWDKIMEIRENQDIVSFREKITTICNQLNTNDVNSAVSCLNDLYLNDLEKIAKKYKPNKDYSFLKAVLSNFPLPIPIPGVIISAKDSFREYQTKRDYGWLYFILDFKDR